MDPKSLQIPVLDEVNNASVSTNNALITLNKSAAQKSFDKACEKETAAIRKIITSGNLELMLALEYRLQLHDLTNYAKTDREIKNTRLGVTDFIAGLTNYERLTTQPEEYRRQADGFPSGSRDKQLDVPMDGLRKAINSQLTRIQQRQSLLTSDAAKELNKARRALLAAIRKEYSMLQQKVVHGD